MLKRISTISMVLLLLGATGEAFAHFPTEMGHHEAPQQSETCTGTVKDSNGESIIGATVIIKGTTIGTITGMDGEFTLKEAKPGDMLHISFVGYQPVEMVWKSRWS